MSVILRGAVKLYYFLNEEIAGKKHINTTFLWIKILIFLNFIMLLA